MKDHQQIADEYQAAFGNFDEIAAPELLLEAEFLIMLEDAVARGHKLTRADIEAKFPDVSWDEVE